MKNISVNLVLMTYGKRMKRSLFNLIEPISTRVLVQKLIFEIVAVIVLYPCCIVGNIISYIAHYF